MINIGIIGLGVGEQHLLAYQRHPDCVVKAICDFDKNVLEKFSRKYPDIYTADKEDEILSDPSIDAVTIASWDNYHHKQIIKALKIGKHVFVEKPLCQSMNEAEEIFSCLNENDKLKITSNLILRKSPRFIEIKQMIHDEELGKIYAIEGDYNYGRKWKIADGWRGEVDGYSGVFGGGVHIIDLFIWLSDNLVDEVFAYGNNICLGESNFNNNDYIVSILKFKNGMLGKFSVNLGCVYPHFHRLSVYGTSATIENDHNYARFYNKYDPSKDYKMIKSEYPGVDKGDLIENFIDAIKNDTEPQISKKEIFNSMSICFAIEESMQTGKKQKVQYLY